MESAVDVHNGLALVRQSFGLIVREPAALGQAARNVLVLVELGEILRRRDDGNFPILATRGLAHRDQLDAI